MKVFLSWAGDYSKGVASVLRDALPTMLQGIDVFMSQHDIDSGTRWAQRLSTELSNSNFGILCLTPTNLESKWLLFEAGAITKHIDGKACGLLCGGLGITEVDGPLSQFQHRALDPESFKTLLHDLNKEGGGRLEKSQVEKIHGKWWPEVASEIGKLSADTTAAPKARLTHEVLEELVERVRGLERFQWRNAAGVTAQNRMVDIKDAAEKAEVTSEGVQALITVTEATAEIDVDEALTALYALRLILVAADL